MRMFSKVITHMSSGLPVQVKSRGLSQTVSLICSSHRLTELGVMVTVAAMTQGSERGSGFSQVTQLVNSRTESPVWICCLQIPSSFSYSILIWGKWKCLGIGEDQHYGVRRRVLLLLEWLQRCL